MPDFLHGIEFIELPALQSVRVVKSAVIALVGIAPLGETQKLILVKNRSDIAQFGKELPGFTIPQSLRAIFAQGNATVVVVNVLNDTDHLVQVTNESKTVTNGKAKTTHAPVRNLVITNSATPTPLTLVKDTDYKIDEFGNITILSYTNIAEGGTLKCSYKRLDVAEVVAADINGTEDEDHVRTGAELYKECYGTLGFKPKIMIAPGFSSLSSVANKLEAMADKYKGVALLDAPAGTTYPVAITGRGPSGAINFYRSNPRTLLLFPGLSIYDLATGANQVRPFSASMAGVISANDSENGYWNSPSNLLIKDIEGIEIPISFDPQDSTTEANTLNSYGIITVATDPIAGRKTWGNRSSAFPANTTPFNFINIRRTWDIVEESIAEAELKYLDRLRVTRKDIDFVIQEVNAFINVLIGRGAFEVGTRMYYNPDRNPTNQLAAGQVVYSFKGATAPPQERMTFEMEFDSTLLVANS